MHLATVDEAGRLDLGDVARQLGYSPGALVQVIRTSAGTLILAIDDAPVLTEATAKRLPAPRQPAQEAGKRIAQLIAERDRYQADLLRVIDREQRAVSAAEEAWAKNDALAAQLAASEQRAAGFESLAERMSALNGELLADRDAWKQRTAALVEAVRNLTALSPCFVSIRPTGDIETCQFCVEDNAHADGCEWIALTAALAAAAPSAASTEDENVRICKGCRGPYHGRALLPSDCERAAEATEDDEHGGE